MLILMFKRVSLGNIPKLDLCFLIGQIEMFIIAVFAQDNPIES